MSLRGLLIIGLGVGMIAIGVGMIAIFVYGTSWVDSRPGRRPQTSYYPHFDRELLLGKTPDEVVAILGDPTYDSRRKPNGIISLELQGSDDLPSERDDRRVCLGFSVDFWGTRCSIYFDNGVATKIYRHSK